MTLKRTADPKTAEKSQPASAGSHSSAAEGAAHANTQQPITEDPPQIMCGTCQHWRPLSGFPSAGQCLKSARAGPAPLITLDYAGCSAWEERA